MPDFDIVIIGAGIAGASLAAEIGGAASVLIIEREEFPGYHATGRSAAFWTESYGGPQVQPLTRASGQWFSNPPADFAADPILTRRGALTIGTDEDKTALDRFCATFARAGADIFEVDRPCMEKHIQRLKPPYRHGVMEPDCCDIDVAALHQGYLRAAKKAGVWVRTRTALDAARHKDGIWHLRLNDEIVTAGIVVNAAGAWADDVARRANVRPIGITPYRRTVVQLQVEPQADPGQPLVLDIRGKFYFKPENGRLWLSPHDETPVTAHDVAAEEIDIARAIDRLEKVVDWRVAHVERSWAGLRSFAPDRLPVYGFDPRQSGFFWCAGQGGFGIQTAPAAAKLAKAILLGLPPEPLIAGIDAKIYSPMRFET